MELGARQYAFARPAYLVSVWITARSIHAAARMNQEVIALTLADDEVVGVVLAPYVIDVMDDGASGKCSPERTLGDDDVFKHVATRSARVVRR